MHRLAWRPAGFLILDLRAEGFRLRFPVSLFLAADLLASFQAWAWLCDLWLAPRVRKALARHLDGGPAVPPALRRGLGHGASRFVRSPFTSGLALGLRILRLLPRVGPATLVDVRTRSGEGIRIRLV